MSGLVIEDALIGWLLARASVAALVGERVFPNYAPQKFRGVLTQYPRLVVSVVSRPRTRSLAGPSGLAAYRFRLECWGETYSQAVRLAAAVRGDRADPGLDGFRGPMQGRTVQAGIVDDGEDDYAPPRDAGDRGRHLVALDARLWFEE